MRVNYYQDIFGRIAEELLADSISIQNGIVPIGLVDDLKSEAIADYERGILKNAYIGKGIEKKRIQEIRGDKVRWLDKQSASEAQLAYWDFLDGLRVYLSEYFRIHLERTELHLALYPKGAFYSRHVDQFKEHSNRIFSIILYLNSDWKTGDGGELRVYNQNGFEDFAPLGGRLIIFRSDIVEHEVLEAVAPRISVTGWIRRDPLIL